MSRPPARIAPLRPITAPLVGNLLKARRVAGPTVHGVEFRSCHPVPAVGDKRSRVGPNEYSSSYLLCLELVSACPLNAGCRGRTTTGTTVALTNIPHHSADESVDALAAGSVIEQKRAQLALHLLAIEAKDLGGLRSLWFDQFGRPPSLRSVDLMRLILSWRLQARIYGGLDAAMRRRLRRPTKADPQSAIDLPVGTKLKREWQGRSYLVEVTTEGFCCAEETYASLSAVAKAITGTNWNGPRFFGLRKGRA